MLKRWAILVLILVVALDLGCAKKEDGVIKVGAVLPLTGDAAAYGQNARDGIMLAIDEINASGGVTGKKLTLILEDSKGQPQPAVSAMQKLVDLDKVTCVIGDVTSSATLAMAPIANQKQVVLLSPSASSPNLTTAGEYVFRNWPSDTFEATVMVDYASKKELKRIAILYVNNDYGKALSEEFEKQFRAVGEEVLSKESFEQNTTDMRSQLTKISQHKPDALYLISFPKDTVIFLGQYRELGGRYPILSTSAFEDPQIATHRSGAAEGVVFSSPLAPSESDTAVRTFKEEYKKKYEKDSGLVADHGYDAVKMLVEAIKLGGGSSGTQIKDGLLKMKDFQGASGKMSFDTNGDVVVPAGLKTVKSGQYEWLK